MDETLFGRIAVTILGANLTPGGGLLILMLYQRKPPHKAWSALVRIECCLLSGCLLAAKAASQRNRNSQL